MTSRVGLQSHNLSVALRPSVTEELPVEANPVDQIGTKNCSAIDRFRCLTIPENYTFFRSASPRGDNTIVARSKFLDLTQEVTKLP